MSVYQFEATNEILFHVTLTDPNTGYEIDPNQLGFVTKFTSFDGTTTINFSDIYGAMDSIMVKNAVGDYQISISTEAYTLGGQLSWAWFARGNDVYPAQGTMAGVLTISAPLNTDPFI